MSGDSASANQTDRAVQYVDHLVVATSDLEKGVRYIEERFGVTPQPGGSHPVYGTRNALVGMGKSCYLEIIGPDLGILQGDEVKVFGIHRLEEPALVTWAAAGSELEDFVESARGELIDLGAVTLGNRRQSDGRELTWTFTDPLAARMGGVLPFFIDWGDTPHPASSLPPDCELLGFSLQHPHPDEVMRRLEFLGLGIPVDSAEHPKVFARIRTPNGDIDL
jgi:hypothetical protein